MGTKKGQIGIDNGTPLVLGLLFLVIVTIIGAQIFQSASQIAGTINEDIDDQALTANAANVTLSLGNTGIDLTDFIVTNRTNATNVVGAGNYTITSLGQFTIITPQFASQPLNFSYNISRVARTAAGNLSEQGNVALTNSSSLYGVLGTVLLALFLIGIVVGFAYYANNY